MPKKSSKKYDDDDDDESIPSSPAPIFTPSKRSESKTVIMKSIQVEPYPPCAISNVVSHLHVTHKQNQKKIALYGKRLFPMFFDPKIFASAQTQFKVGDYPTVKATFFARKSQTLTGGVSEDHNRLVAWGIVRFLSKQFNMDIGLTSITTKNIVAHIYMPNRINLDTIFIEVSDRCEYKPECIDCCRVTSSFGKPRVFLIFSTGAISLVGSKNMRELEELYLEACKLATKHECHDSSSKAQAQKYKQKRKSIYEDALKTTNIEIETAMGMKRRKVSGHLKYTLFRNDSIASADDMFDLDTSVSAAYLKMVKEEEAVKGQRDPIISHMFTPSLFLSS